MQLHPKSGARAKHVSECSKMRLGVVYCSSTLVGLAGKKGILSVRQPCGLYYIDDRPSKKPVSALNKKCGAVWLANCFGIHSMRTKHDCLGRLVGKGSKLPSHVLT